MHVAAADDDVHDDVHNDVHNDAGNDVDDGDVMSRGGFCGLSSTLLCC